MENTTVRALLVRIEELKQELADEREAHAKTMDLLIKGESLRSSMMLHSILDGVVPKCATQVTQ